mmetsp:Transcript_32965/g.38366  ORF Transcript_32965/g.38366 Transcript_32965/m.38366 type:complete len:277 (+) Transcript_32965:242-1072(+)
MNNTRIISNRVIRQVCRQARRSQSTSTMGLSSQGSIEFGEKAATLVSTIQERKEFSTVVASYDFDSEFEFGSILPSSTKVFGVEMDPIQAASALKTDDVFDKVIMFISHGETTDTEDNETMFKTSLSGKGIGHAMNFSRETAIFCTKKSGLIPDMFVVSPERSTAESALIAFPQYAPGNVLDIPWVCSNKCTDSNANPISDVNLIEDAFSGIDFSSLKETNDESSDFLSWLSERDEKVIVGKLYAIMIIALYIRNVIFVAPNSLYYQSFLFSSFKY